MKNTLIILPNTIFEQSIEDIKKYDISRILIIYDKYYFNENQHKQKLALFFASMEEYIDYINTKTVNVEITECREYKDKCINIYKNAKYYIYDPLDKYIKRKYTKLIISICGKENLIFLYNKSILLNGDDIKHTYVNLINVKNNNKKIFIRHSDFYKYMRIKYDILLEKDNKPEGGAWSFDTLNRNKFNKGYKEKDIYINKSNYAAGACKLVNKEFKNAYGNCSYLYYPSNFKSSKTLLTTFINFKLKNFGKHQDAISKDVYVGEHANISAIMNIGLITPDFVISRVVKYYYSLDKKDKKEILNSVEGIVRQILGWREYMRFVYHYFSNNINKGEYLEKIRSDAIGKIHKSWYNGTTGIFIFDNIINKISETGYAHHIERLMVLNNALIMYGFSRKEINKWFMCMFVDSYDWVMTGCVSMNHNSLNDNIKYMNRVYISGDNYIKKMSDYKDKESLAVFQSLFKSFTKNHSQLLKKDYNLSSYISRFVK